ncbi:MAG TPA: hypothetical protein VJW96_09490 [Terriglobales bacterium]|jgi:hypothetical protein|nr:hypothetical protein [Terriglobales bacterium]
MRSFHVYCFCCGLLATLLAFSSLTLAGNAPAPRISKETREEIVHAFNEELVYIRARFPMGRTGLTLKDGTVSPSGPELDHLLALWGPAAKPGDRARISNVVIKDNYIRFEINGGPIKKQKWYQHITIVGADASVPVSPSDPSANARGSFVDLYFDKYVPEMTGPELKELLRPVFDFDAKSALDAYLETVSPQVKDAIKNHHVLVGMNREMVIYAKGRPPNKVRETANEVEYEEWIYGTPPQDVDFVRFVGDEVVRVETMKVDGQKIVRVEKEVDLGAATVAKKQADRPANAPTLRRPGEEMPESNPANPSSTPPIGPPPQPTGPGSGPGPNWSLPATPTTG